MLSCVWGGSPVGPLHHPSTRPTDTSFEFTSLSLPPRLSPSLSSSRKQTLAKPPSWPSIDAGRRVEDVDSYDGRCHGSSLQPPSLSPSTPASAPVIFAPLAPPNSRCLRQLPLNAASSDSDDRNDDDAHDDNHRRRCHRLTCLLGHCGILFKPLSAIVSAAPRQPSHLWLAFRWCNPGLSASAPSPRPQPSHRVSHRVPSCTACSEPAAVGRR
jgi:hypothetical protein